ncbi:hypothetical protein CRG98_022733 [Punica granatum]|uniref:Late embryogenesis abundant protein LEA-2 subgroup domain-containing protein n=1 Tax=Punica granatum TaxID=22663 RepID=A0A2I0JKV4_PUNGR|nr:hypothetical protein CRG98_022733 [Punica granatum]
MAESYHNQEYPLAPAGINGYPRSDAESLNDKEEKRRKRIKWAIYISVFAVFQVIVIVVFSLVVMRVQRPKFRVGTLRIQALTTGTQVKLPLLTTPTKKPKPYVFSAAFKSFADLFHGPSKNPPLIISRMEDFSVTTT